MAATLAQILTTGFDQQNQALSEIARLLQAMGQNLAANQKAGAAPPGTAAGGKTGGLIGGLQKFGTIASGLGSFTGAISAVTSVLGPMGKAIGGAVVALLNLPQTLRPWVEAFNPQVLVIFDQAMRDLSATVGQ